MFFCEICDKKVALSAKNVVCVFLAVLTSLLAILFYSGSLIGLISLGLMFFYLLIVAVPLTFLFFDKIFYLLPRAEGIVAEELTGTGIVPLILLFIAIFDMPKKIRIAGWFTFVMGFIKAKLMVFALPFLAVGMVELDNKMKKKWKRWPNLTVICLIFVLVYFFLGLSTQPSQADFDLVDKSMDLSVKDGVILVNDWDFGWLLIYKGYDTNYFAGYPHPDYNNMPTPFYAITQTDLNHLDCLLIDSSVRFKLFLC